MLREGFRLDQTKASPAGYSLTPEPYDSYTAVSFCAGKSRKEKKSTSQSQRRLLSDSSACFYPAAYSIPTLQRKEVRSKGCKHEYIAKTLNRNTVAKHTLAACFGCQERNIYYISIIPASEHFTCRGGFQVFAALINLPIFQLKCISRPNL